MERRRREERNSLLEMPCELFVILIDRLGLCKPLFVAHILPHDASKFSQEHNTMLNIK